MFDADAYAFHLGVESPAPLLEVHEACLELDGLVVQLVEVFVFEADALIHAAEDVFHRFPEEGSLGGKEGVQGVLAWFGGEAVRESVQVRTASA